MSWNPNSGDAAFTPKTDREKHRNMDDYEPTTVANFLELWRDFDGQRLPVSFDRDWLDVVAVHDGQRISLAITNMGGRQLAIDLSGVANRLGATAVQTRLNYHQGEVVFKPEHDVDASAVPVDVNETTIVRLILDQPLAPQKTVELKRWYAHETAVKSDGKPLPFTVEIDDPDSIRTARLVVGIHRGGGVDKPITARLNGKSIEIDTGDADEFSEFFAPLETSVAISDLRESNKITITAQMGATITSVQLLTHELMAESE